MRELTINELFFVSGTGNASSSSSSGGSDTSGNNYGDSNHTSNNSSSFTWATTILGAAGGVIGGRMCGDKCAAAGSVVGGYAGHQIDNVDWNKLGEDYKIYIDNQIKSGTLPPD